MQAYCRRRGNSILHQRCQRPFQYDLSSASWCIFWIPRKCSDGGYVISGLTEARKVTHTDIDWLGHRRTLMTLLVIFSIGTVSALISTQLVSNSAPVTYCRSGARPRDLCRARCVWYWYRRDFGSFPCLRVRVLSKGSAWPYYWSIDGL